MNGLYKNIVIGPGSTRKVYHREGCRHLKTTDWPVQPEDVHTHHPCMVCDPFPPAKSVTT